MLKVNYYDNIDTMPAFNYLGVIERDKVNLLIKKRGLFGNYTKALENIQRQLVDRFGISETFDEIIELEKELLCLRCDLAVTGDKFINTHIRLVEADLKRVSEQKSIESSEMQIIIEKWLGFKLNLHQISIAEWYTYLKQYSEFVKQNNKQ